jgi:hypothetical protein
MQSPIMGINRCYIKYFPKGLSYSVYMLENGGKYLEYDQSYWTNLKGIYENSITTGQAIG